MSLPENHATIDYVPFFDDLIATQQKAIISFKRWSGLVATIGFLIITVALVFYVRDPKQAASQIVGLGGLAISAFGLAYPYKEIAPRRSKISACELLKQGFEKFPALSDDERKRLVELAEDAIKKQFA